MGPIFVISVKLIREFPLYAMNVVYMYMVLLDLAKSRLITQPANMYKMSGHLFLVCTADNLLPPDVTK